MEIKFCKNEDGNIAIGTGIRPIEYCRPCYIETYGPEFVEVEVHVPYRDMGIDREQLGIACAKTGTDVFDGGTAWVDPVETNVVALVYTGFAKLVQPKTAAPKATRTTEASEA